MSQVKPSVVSVLRAHPSDDVAVSVGALAAGQTIEVDGAMVTTLESIPAGHKLALRSIAAGDPIAKYGFPIGHASEAIAIGSWVHSHNLVTALEASGRYVYQPVDRAESVRPKSVEMFDGYRRPNGAVATRNEIWVLNTVGCVNGAAEKIARAARERFAGVPGLDGIHAFPHPYGCSQLGDDLCNTQRVLAGLLRHPNAGGVLVLGLGCENNQLDDLLARAEADGHPPDRARLRFFDAQEVDDEVERGVEAVGELVVAMACDRREPVPVSELVIGLKCGGSDGFSGLTANPLVGRVAERLVAAGGSAVLTEVPEMFGAEQVLMNRAVNEAVFDEVVSLIDGFKRYFIDHGQPVGENPSPGNKEGGLTTLEEKSLGAIQKGGRTPVSHVIPYGGLARGAGLTLLEAPGNDAVSSTAMVAAGATVLLFTTGRGTPLGFPAPTIKIASNSDLATRKPGWIDFDAGRLLMGEGMDAVADALFAQVLAVASGEPTRNELNDDREIAIWKSGVTL